MTTGRECSVRGDGVRFALVKLKLQLAINLHPSMIIRRYLVRIAGNSVSGRENGGVLRGGKDSQRQPRVARFSRNSLGILRNQVSRLLDGIGRRIPAVADLYPYQTPGVMPWNEQLRSRDGCDRCCRG